MLQCGVVEATGLLFRKIKRTILPPDCSVSVRVDSEGYQYFEDRYKVQFVFSELVEEAEFVPQVEFEPEALHFVVKNPDRNLSRYGNDRFSIEDWDLQPDVEYKVRVAPFFSQRDCKSEETVQFTIPARNYRPNFYTNRNNVIESESSRILGVQVRNLKQLKIQSAPISIGHLSGAIGRLGEKYTNATEGLSWSNQTWDLDGKINPNGEQGFPLSKVLGKEKTGWVAIRFSQKVVEWNSDKPVEKTETLFVQSTNLGLTSKEDSDFHYIWVNTLDKAKPVPEAQVNLYSSGVNSGSCRTNAEGFCQIPRSGSVDYKRTVIVAEKNDDKSFLYLYDTKLYSDYYYYSSFVTSSKFYFDRKLYRPGELVEIKAISGERKNGGFFPTANQNLKVKIVNTKGETVLSRSLTSSSQGGVWFNYSIPIEGALGHYTVSISDSSDRSFGSDSFQVEEFRPVSFAVKVETDSASLIAETNLKFKIQANYLFGTPMGNSKYKYAIYKKSFYPELDSYSDYAFGYRSYYYYDYDDYYSEDSSGYISGDEGVLDAGGAVSLDHSIGDQKTEFVTDNEKISLAEPTRYLIEGTVSDVDGKSVTKSESVSFLPSENLLGLRCDDRFKALGKSFQFQILNVSYKSKKAVEDNVTVYIVHNDWSSVESKGFAGSLFRSNSLKKRVIEKKSLKLGSGPTGFQYQSQYPGSHSLLVVNKSGAYSRMDFYTYKSDSFYSWDFRSDDAIEFSFDKPSYKPGDTAKILIKSPYPEAQAIVSVERDKVYFHNSFHMKGNSDPIEIPIREEYLPNVEFKVMLVTGRTPPPKDLSDKDLTEFKEYDYGVPKLKSGSKPIKVDIQSKVANLEITPNKSEYSPREKVTLKIKTLPRSELAVSVADRGILDLVAYSFVNPAYQFYKIWNNLVTSFDFRDWIVKQTNYVGKGDSPGGDYGDDQSEGGFGQDGEDGTRKDFRPTAFWNPNIVTDSDGEATITFQLPDNLTTFRVMAVAAKDGIFASNNKEFIVRKSLILKKNAPRFVRINDGLEIGATVTNNTKIPGKFSVRFDSKTIPIPNPKQSLDLKPLETKEINVKVAVDLETYTKLFGQSNGKNMDLVYRVSAEPENYDNFVKAGIEKSDIRDSLEVKIPFIRPEPKIINRLAGYTDSSAKFDVSYPNQNDVLMKQAYFSFNASSTVLTGLKNAFDFYGSNPYYCMEQRTSAYLLTISAGSLLKQFGYTPPNEDSYDFSNIEKLFVDELKDFQNNDGSFRLWKSSSYSYYGYPYLTAYVVNTMQLAKRAGYRIDSGAYQKALNYLTTTIKNPKEREEDSFQTLTLIYAILSRDGLNSQGLEKSLGDNFDKLSIKSQGIYLSAYADSKSISSYESDPKLKSLYTKYKKRFTITDSGVDWAKEESNRYWLSYYSSGSVLASLVSTMVRVDANSSDLPKVIRFALSSRSQYLWMDTQTSGTLAFALKEYRDKFEAVGSDLDFRVGIGEKLLWESKIQDGSNTLQSREVPLTQVSPEWKFPSANLEFAKKSNEGRLYFNSAIHYIPLHEKLKPESKGLTLQKKIYSLHGKDSKGNWIKKDASGSLERGKIYLVSLVLESSIPRSFVLIQDPIPSNAEVVNTKFATESIEYQDLDSGNNDNDYWWESSPAYNEYRDDKVIFSRDYFSGGTEEFTYLLRPVSRGTSVAPASRAFLMYDPNVYSNTGSGELKVE